MDDGKLFIQRQLGPCCAVFPTADATRICRRNGLDFAQLLAPFADAPYQRTPKGGKRRILLGDAAG